MNAHTTTAPDYKAINARFTTYRRLILLLLIAGIVFNAALFWLYSQPREPVAALVKVEDMQATGETLLCPGETLSYQYVLRARAATVVEESVATLHLGSEVVHYGGAVVREAFPAAMALVHREEWQVPDDARLGDYVRLVAVTAPSRVMEPAFGMLAFKVEACE